jgi:glycosyltransferase involved in cell wall biosynthesis
MKILVIASIFPPHILGGAEVSASNLATGLLNDGHDVSVLTVRQTSDQEPHTLQGLRIVRESLPRAYPVSKFKEAKGWQKPIWHLQDLVDPRNIEPLKKYIAEFGRPDVVFVHILQGFGYNLINSIERLNLPVIFFLHDLSFACVKTSMFKNNSNCLKLCLECKLSSAFKSNLLGKLTRVGYCSPSQANIDRLKQFIPIEGRPQLVTPNANTYCTPRTERVEAQGVVRLLYVGQLTDAKGIEFLLRVLEDISYERPLLNFSLVIAGSGPLESKLRSKYDSKEWLNFTGFVPQREVSNLMNDADLLCVPSIWFENYPGVAVHALEQSLPVMGSKTGGIAEIVTDGENGILVPPGNFDAWKRELIDIMESPSILKKWREAARTLRVDLVAQAIDVRSKIISFAHTVIEGARH